jgi:hypothetical protein
MDYIKVKDKEHLFRDVNSNGIVNTDEDAYKTYIENYRRQKNSMKKIDELEIQISEIKTDLKDIKHLILKMLNS